ncbi:hypothetical protein Tco_0645994 [Tanacetum coccineum]
MENANQFVPVPPNGLCARVSQELLELCAISSIINSYLKRVDHAIPPNEIYMDDLESENELIDTPLVSPFLDSDDESDDGEVIDDHDGEDLAFPCMIEGLESTRRNLVAVVRDVYMFVGSFTDVTDFVVLKDIGEFIVSDMTDVVMGRAFRVVTQLEYNYAKGLISFMAGDGVAGIKQHRHDLSSDGIRNMATASRRGRLKEDLDHLRGDSVNLQREAVVSTSL